MREREREGEREREERAHIQREIIMIEKQEESEMYCQT